MKKGFTMIELIFVIVILGVLASVAIPRLAATRDDAEVAKAATNLTTAVSDITAYYTAKGSFYEGKTSQNTTGTKITDFTKLTNALDKDGNLNVKGKTACVKVELPDNTATNSTNPAVKITLNFGSASGKDDAVCKTLKTLPGVKSMCGKSGANETISNKCEIQVGGSGGIQF